MKKLYRHFITLGADAVINHHQHCFSGYELYKKKPIFYGLGNFNFDSYVTNQFAKSWNKGYAVLLQFKDDKCEFRMIPYVQNDNYIGIHLSNYDDFELEIQAINKIIEDDKLLENSFVNYCSSKKYETITSLMPITNRLLLTLIRRGKLGNVFGIKKILSLRNKFSCESHSEVLLYTFKITHSITHFKIKIKFLNLL